MKTLTTITLLLTIWITSYSQAYLTPSIGISQQGYFIAGLGFNYQIGRIQLTVEGIDNVNVKGSLNAGGKFGITLYKTERFAVVPAFGYYYHYFSSDKNEYQLGKNYFTPGYFIKGESKKIFVELGYIKEINLRIGLKIPL